MLVAWKKDDTRDLRAVLALHLGTTTQNVIEVTKIGDTDHGKAWYIQDMLPNFVDEIIVTEDGWKYKHEVSK